jgi:hypothetical protein
MGERLLAAIWFLVCGVFVWSLPYGVVDRTLGIGYIWSGITSILAWSLFGKKGERL